MMADTLQIIDPDGKKVGTVPRVKREVLLRMHRAMVYTRAFDDRCMKLQRTGKIGFSIPNLGVEGVSVGAAAALDPGTDWVCPSYRDFAIAFYHDVPLVHMMDNMFGNQNDFSKGRQMPVHWTFLDPIRWLSISSPLGTQIPHAVGVALAMKRKNEEGVALAAFGDGTTSTAGFHSGLNFAGVLGVPVVFLCQNNQWAISCPIENQTASSSLAVKGDAYGIPGIRVDGNDVLAVYRVVSEAVKRARAGEGPTLIEAVTFRMGGHSTSDDPTKYIEPQVFEEWKARDPLKRFQTFLMREGHLDEQDIIRLREEAAAEVLAAAKKAETLPNPPLETIFTDVYEELPSHLKNQSRDCIDHHASRGEGVNEMGEFPL